MHSKIGEGDHVYPALHVQFVRRSVTAELATTKQSTKQPVLIVSQMVLSVFMQLQVKLSADGCPSVFGRLAQSGAAPLATSTRRQMSIVAIMVLGTTGLVECLIVLCIW